MRTRGTGPITLSAGLRASAGLAAVVLLASCSSSSATTPPPTEAATVAPPTAAPQASAGTGPEVSFPSATGVESALDPCQLVTASEASSLAGTSFSAGTPSTLPNHLKECVYGAQTKNVFTVEVAQAPDVATAQADKTAALAAMQKLASSGITTTQLPNLGDGAVLFQASQSVGGQTISVVSIAILKGTTFVGFSDVLLGGSAPTSDAIQAQAQTTLGRVP